MKTHALTIFMLIIVVVLRAQDSTVSTRDTILPHIVISEVLIKTERNAVRIKGATTLLDLRNSSAFGTKLIDALPIVPGIQLDRINKVVTFENKSVLLFVDGRQIMIPSSSIYTYIQSIPTASIKHVAFNSHPGAKFDAGNQCAIINITTKKAADNHIDFNPYYNYSKNKYHSRNQGGSLYGNRNKIDFALSYDDYFEKIFNDKVSKQLFFKEGDVDYTRHDAEYEIATGLYRNINGTVGYKSKSGELILSYLRAATGPTKSTGLQHTEFIQQNNSIQPFETKKIGRQTNNSNSYTAAYNHRLDTLGMAVQLFYDHTNIQYRNILKQLFMGFVNDSANHQHIGTNSSLNTLKIDFNNRKEAKFFIEIGLKYSWTKNDFNNYSSTYNDYRFSVDESIMGSYFTIKREWENFNTTMGIRGENTLLEGNFDNDMNQETQSVNRSYFRLFPNIVVEHLRDNHSIAFVADTKIQRPNYGQYNPLEIINDPYSVSRGNPFLSSASVYNYSMKYTFHNRYSFTTFFTNIKDQVGDIVVKNDHDISVTEPINLDYSNYYGVNVGANFKPTRWWNISFWAQISNMDKKGTLPGRVIRTTAKKCYYASTSHKLLLPHDYLVDLNAFVSGNGSWGGIYNQDNGWGEVNVSAKKEFFKKKLAFEVFANDVFDTNSKLSAHYQDSFYSSQFTNRYGGRCLGFAISFNFNKGVQKIDVDTDTDEKNRSN